MPKFFIKSKDIDNILYFIDAENMDKINVKEGERKRIKVSAIIESIEGGENG